MSDRSHGAPGSQMREVRGHREYGTITALKHPKVGVWGSKGTFPGGTRGQTGATGGIYEETDGRI